MNCVLHNSEDLMMICFQLGSYDTDNAFALPSLTWTHLRNMALIKAAAQLASCGSRHGVVPTGRQRLHACAQHRVDDVCDGAAAAEVIDWLREALHEWANCTTA